MQRRILPTWRAVEHRVLHRRLREPSFAYKDAEMRRLRRLTKEQGAEHPVWGVNDKDDAAAFADALGVRRARDLGAWGAAAQVPFDALPDATVLKPVHGAGGRGVHLLARRGGGWVDVATGRPTTPDAVVADLAGLAERGEASASVLAEELVSDPRRPGARPVDWKLTTFRGRIGVIVAKAGSPGPDGTEVIRWRIFDEHWRDLGRAATQHPRDTSIAPPVHADELLEVARRVSRAVTRPFVRVDLYDSADGPVFGEVTPMPGGSHTWRRDLDRWMGRMWEEAEAELLADLYAAGAMDPRLPAPPPAAAA